MYAVIYMYSSVLTWRALPVVFIVAGFGFAFTQLSRVQWIALFVLLTLIRWIEIYPVDTVIPAFVYKILCNLFAPFTELVTYLDT